MAQIPLHVIQMGHAHVRIIFLDPNVQSVNLVFIHFQIAIKVKIFLYLMKISFEISFDLACNCNVNGSENGSISCDQYGKCTCKNNVVGDKCHECEIDFFGFPNCRGI